MLEEFVAAREREGTNLAIVIRERVDAIERVAADDKFTEAMARTKDLKPSEIRDEIAKTKDFNGVTGKITIDAQRNAVKPAVVVKVDGNVNRYVTTIAP